MRPHHRRVAVAEGISLHAVTVVHAYDRQGLGNVRNLKVSGPDLIVAQERQGREALVVLQATAQGLKQTHALPFPENNGLLDMVVADFDSDGTRSVAWINDSGGGQ